MCNQREKLIGYLYDECESGERVAVQEHLAACAECRAEIASLRSVREDLAAWEVPEHESVWKPFAPAPAPQWWQQVPRWAFAAAASILILSGAVGGAATLAFMPRQTAPVQQAREAQPLLNVTTTSEMAALRAEITKIHLELSLVNDKVQLATSRVMAVSNNGDRQALERQVADLRDRGDKQVILINELNHGFEAYKRALNIRMADLKTNVSNMLSVLETAKAGGGVQ
jgi:hypothetical protein